MIELSLGELKQGLICCTVYKNCSGCPLYMGPENGPHEECTYKLMSAAFNCINTMEKDLADAVKWANMQEEHAKNLQEVISEGF